MAKGTISNQWFVSVEAPRHWRIASKRAPARQTVTFPTESEAKQFAKAMLSDGMKIMAGTLHPINRRDASLDPQKSISGLREKKVTIQLSEMRLLSEIATKTQGKPRNRGCYALRTHADAHERVPRIRIRRATRSGRVDPAEGVNRHLAEHGTASLSNHRAMGSHRSRVS